ncbi:hypothetical protein PLICRDRAFT_40745, partial [Plicaturopsis crispa FD-325 SS-3]
MNFPPPRTDATDRLLADIVQSCGLQLESCGIRWNDSIHTAVFDALVTVCDPAKLLDYMLAPVLTQDAIHAAFPNDLDAKSTVGVLYTRLITVSPQRALRALHTIRSNGWLAEKWAHLISRHEARVRKETGHTSVSMTYVGITANTAHTRLVDDAAAGTNGHGFIGPVGSHLGFTRSLHETKSASTRAYPLFQTGDFTFLQIDYLEMVLVSLRRLKDSLNDEIGGRLIHASMARGIEGVMKPFAQHIKEELREFVILADAPPIYGDRANNCDAMRQCSVLSNAVCGIASQLVPLDSQDVLRIVDFEPNGVSNRPNVKADILASDIATFLSSTAECTVIVVCGTNAREGVLKSAESCPDYDTARPLPQAGHTEELITCFYGGRERHVIFTPHFSRPVRVRGVAAMHANDRIGISLIIGTIALIQHRVPELEKQRLRQIFRVASRLAPPARAAYDANLALRHVGFENGSITVAVARANGVAFSEVTPAMTAAFNEANGIGWIPCKRLAWTRRMGRAPSDDEFEKELQREASANVGIRLFVASLCLTALDSGITVQARHTPETYNLLERAYHGSQVNVRKLDSLLFENVFVNPLWLRFTKKDTQVQESIFDKDGEPVGDRVHLAVVLADPYQPLPVALYGRFHFSPRQLTLNFYDVVAGKDLTRPISLARLWKSLNHRPVVHQATLEELVDTAFLPTSETWDMNRSWSQSAASGYWHLAEITHGYVNSKKNSTCYKFAFFTNAEILDASGNSHVFKVAESAPFAKNKMWTTSAQVLPSGAYRGSTARLIPECTPHGVVWYILVDGPQVSAIKLALTPATDWTWTHLEKQTGCDGAPDQRLYGLGMAFRAPRVQLRQQTLRDMLQPVTPSKRDATERAQSYAKRVKTQSTEDTFKKTPRSATAAASSSKMAPTPFEYDSDIEIVEGPAIRD